MCVAALVAVALVVAAPAAEDAAVQSAVEAYEALYYRAACADLDRAVAGSGLSRDDRIVALAYLGRCLAVLGRPRAARKRFLQLLRLAPDAEVERKESPRIREAFEAARRELGDRLPSSRGATESVPERTVPDETLPAAEPRPLDSAIRTTEPSVPDGDSAAAEPELPVEEALAAIEPIPMLAPESIPSLTKPRATTAGPTETGTDSSRWWVGAAVLGGVAVTAIALIVLLRADTGGEPTARWELP